MKIPGSGDKALLMVQHTTRLDYAGPAVEAHSEVRKTPVDTGLQRVITSKLDVSPGTAVRAHRDYFGNVVHHFDLLEPHESLIIRAESVVETSDGVCCGPEAAPDPRPWEQRLAEFLHWSSAVPNLPQYDEITHRVRSDLAAEEFLDALAELGGTFYKRFRYDTESTGVHSTPQELFDAGGGVCQDLAHALLGVLRGAGVPARYASGYLYDPEGDPTAKTPHPLKPSGEPVRGAAASHAWVQAWHQDLGWVGIDPTNDKLVDWQYVRVAIGRDYTDVQPLRGIFDGPAGQTLSVEVHVRRLG